MARRGYPPEFRRRVVKLVEGGRKVSEVAADLGISEQTIYTWRRQARIDAGLEAGLSTSEQAELAVAKKRIRELETELAIHYRATEILKEKTSPKGRTRRSEWCSKRAHKKHAPATQQPPSFLRDRDDSEPQNTWARQLTGAQRPSLKMSVESQSGLLFNPPEWQIGALR